MKFQTINKLGPLAGIAMAVAATESFLAAPTTPADDADDVREILDILRSDANFTKITTLNQVLKLTPIEAETFWPIYRSYEKELAAQNERKISLLRDFFTRHRSGKLDDKTAAELADRWLAAVEERVALWKTFHEKISHELSAIRAAQFLQVEHQIALFIDLNIASEMPLIRSSDSGKTP